MQESQAQIDEQDKAATRGNPSFVWREGQERRFRMVQSLVSFEGKRVLDVGCGVGKYTEAFQRLTPHVVGIEVELERAREARSLNLNVVQAVGEELPFESESFDVVFSHEVVEHVQDDRQMAVEMARVTRSGGRLVIFCPNRWYPFETHGHYWKGEYHFGNSPLINYLPDRWRNRLAPHVRAYTSRNLLDLFQGLAVKRIYHTQIYPGFDKIAARSPRLGCWLRRIIYFLERTPLRRLGLSHLLVLEKG
ncbi:MAG: class I SAM-dependent methyltransferase [Anaerolineales bacterium]|nr:class I SAM-dependent methyltransferase [Anaerolineales bacterium]